MASRGWAQVFCLSVGIKSTSVIVRCLLFGEEAGLGGSGPLPWLSSATTGGGSVLLSCPVWTALSIFFAAAAFSAGRKWYWLEVGLPSSLKRNKGEMRWSALSFFT